MSTFWKIFLGLLSFLAVVVAALAIFDKVLNKNRIKGDYLECDVAQDIEEDE